MAEKRSEGEIAEQLIRKRRRIKTYESRKTTMKWIGVIVIVAVLTIVLLNVVSPLFTKIDIIDTTYRPRDVERQYHQIQKMREGEPDKTLHGNWQEVRSGNYNSPKK